MKSFSIDNIAVGLGNFAPGRRVTIAEAHLVLGSARHRIFLLASGEVVFPSSLADVDPLGRIAKEYRCRVLDHFIEVLSDRVAETAT
jgi:hypothetical protein